MKNDSSDLDCGTKSGADALLQSLKSNGIDYLFVNAGSDFAPIIESYARQLSPDEFPTPIIVPYEGVAVGMAHGYYLATGQPQAVMVHVNVGLANSVMGVMNAFSDNVPLIMMSGRTPLTQHNRLGSKITPVQYGQEMFDQSAIVRESTKFDYELRYPEQAAELVNRAYAIAMSEPRGPVYLSLPREPLVEPISADQVVRRSDQTPSTPQHPNPDAVERAVQMLANAKAPLMILQRGDIAGRVAKAVDRMATKHALKTIEVSTIRNIIPGDHPMRMPDAIENHLPNADVVLVVDASVPWIEKKCQPAPDAKVIHVGPDPLFQNLPMRHFQIDLGIAGETAAAVEMIADGLDQAEPETGNRFAEIKAEHDSLVQKISQKAARGKTAPTNADWVGHCISEALPKDALLFSERGPKTNQLMLKQANQFFGNTFAGGLGWCVPAAIGASMADRSRLVVSIVGDGSYIFANPVACHQVMEAYKLPVLTIVLNNGRWNAVYNSTKAIYPDGAAVNADLMPMTDLSTAPKYTQIASASGAYTESVADGAELPAALERAINVIKTEQRHVLLEVMTDKTMT